MELALIFALHLQRQRALWLLALPGAEHRGNGPLEVPFDSGYTTSRSESMNDSVDDGEDAKLESIMQNKKPVGLFVVPALFERGSMDGQKFGADENVVEKALIYLN